VMSDAIGERQAGMADILDVQLRLDLRHTTATPVEVIRAMLKSVGRRHGARCVRCVMHDSPATSYEPGRRGQR